MHPLIHPRGEQNRKSFRFFFFVFFVNLKYLGGLTGQEKKIVFCSGKRGVRRDRQRRGNFQQRHKSQKLSADSAHLEPLHFSKVQEQGGEGGVGGEGEEKGGNP